MKEIKLQNISVRKKCIKYNIRDVWAVVVAHLANWLPPTPEICRSNPDICLSTVFQFREDEPKRKRGREWPI